MWSTNAMPDILRMRIGKSATHARAFLALLFLSSCGPAATPEPKLSVWASEIRAEQAERLKKGLGGSTSSVGEVRS